MVSQKRASLSWTFARKGLSPKNGRGLLQIEVYLDRKQRKYISTGEHFSPEDWSLILAAWKDSKKVKKLNSDLALKLDKIKKFWHSIEEVETALILKGQKLTTEELDIHLEKRQPLTFNDFFKNQLEADKSLKASTRRPHQNTLNKLNAFRNRIEFNQINYELIEGFDNFLRGQSLNLNSIQGHHIRLGKYINLAINKELIEKNPYKNFKVKGEEPERTFLLMEEIERIEKLDYSENPRLDRIKDLFLFGCFTGLRYSDLIQLAPDHIEITSKGAAIRIKQQKVGTTVYLPLYSLFNGKAEVILQKYLKDVQKSLFNPISNQKANEYLKIIQHDAEINKSLSMHAARHTFGTQIAARTEDAFLVMRLMGHKDLDMSRIYVHMAEQITDRKLEKIEW